MLSIKANNTGAYCSNLNSEEVLRRGVVSPMDRSGECYEAYLAPSTILAFRPGGRLALPCCEGPAYGTR